LTILARETRDYLKPEVIEGASEVDVAYLGLRFQTSARAVMKQYARLTDVFSNNPLPSLDESLHIYYLGMSYQSIGVISLLLDNELKTSMVVESGDFTEQELQESIIAAKLEAIAANTVANMAVMPTLISVKMGFENYRFISFHEINDYYVQILSKGNLRFMGGLLNQLAGYLAECVSRRFVGDLGSFNKAARGIAEFMASRHNEFGE
jgi:hypothetical protein